MSVPDIGWLYGQRPPSPFDVIAHQERKQILGIFSEAPERPEPGAPRKPYAVPVQTPVAVVLQLDRVHVAILRLRYRNDLTFRQIALLIQVGEDAVRHMHDRIIDWIREDLERRKIRTIDHI